MDRPTAQRKKAYRKSPYDVSQNPMKISEQHRTTRLETWEVGQNELPLEIAVKQAQRRVEQKRAKQNYEQFKKTEKKRPKKGITIMLILLIVLSGAGFAGWYYWWTTYATFEYTLQPIVTIEGQQIDPNDFIYTVDDMDRVTATYRRPGFTPEAGQQDVQLTLARGWRTVEANASLIVLTHVKGFSHEYREEGEPLKAHDFITNSEESWTGLYNVQFTEEPKPLEQYEVGEVALKLSLNGKPFEVALTVVDTTAPTADAVNKSILIGEEVEPRDFVSNVRDASPIDYLRFIEEPDIFARRDQIVQVEVADIHGNIHIVSSGLTIRLNQEPPKIEGVETIATMVGDTILYRQGVTAHDDFGRELNVEVDSSLVDQNEEGIYTVVYRAVDKTGLFTEIEAQVHVVAVDLDYVNMRVAEVLAEIINDGMTQLEQVYAIHTWVRRNVNYAATRGGPLSAYEGAYRALQDRRGNCYIFYSISEVLLTEAGIPNMLIERIPGTPTNHRWNLINPDGLGWHHFDSFPSRVGSGLQMAYFTDNQSRNFTRLMRELEDRPVNFYYSYDRDLYPEVVP